ncbi:MAG TPA: DUF2680 domain-containing protein [Bacillus bacterium]|nr:DUF2680 domain-containing protein [Bacillus sp. (in: firmicutes)]
MKKILLVLVFGITSTMINSNITFADNMTTAGETEITIYDNEMDCTKKMKFTAAQMRRLDYIYYRIYRDYVDLIETYAWAGALTQEQKITRYRMLANYMKTFQQRKYQWCSEHEDDEWEEEWYNRDNENEDEGYGKDD